MGPLRTLVISDLHLGGRLQHGVLTHPEALATLLEALDDFDRLVLLGDTVELLERRPQQAMAIAEPVLRAIGARLGRDRDVIVVPGNHDLALIRTWVRAQGALLSAATAVPVDASAGLGRVASWLAPARVSVHYPGVWLGGAVWATHGHYLDRHLLPESAFGIARGLLGRLPRDGAIPIDYELAGGPSLTKLEALLTRTLPRPLAELVEDMAELGRAASMPDMPRLLLRPRFARVTSRLLSVQMRRASIPALARVVHRLGVGAEWVLFGHVHRLGPLPGDAAGRWQGPTGTPRIANTGSWVYEPLLVHNVAPPHPYWPGGAVVLEDGAEPRPVGLLDALPAAALH